MGGQSEEKVPVMEKQAKFSKTCKQQEQKQTFEEKKIVKNERIRMYLIISAQVCYSDWHVDLERLALSIVSRTFRGKQFANVLSDQFTKNKELFSG